MGEDAPGSVQVVPEDVVPAASGAISELSEAAIARRVQAIFDDPDHWVDGTNEDESRFSLGGNQGKFALARIGDTWFEPNGRAPSTHIVKPGMVLAAGRTDSDVQAVEFVTMQAARRLEVHAAAVEIIDFAGVSAFVTTRFDRRTGVNSDVRRIHQEDFCQALSIYPSLKYEEDGGPTMGDMVRVVAEASSPAYRQQDARALADLFAFNLLTAGVDAHAKNHGLLHVGGATRLAPAYDLISAHGIWTADRVKYKAGPAVRYGKERKFQSISGRNLARAADVLRTPREEFVARLEVMATRLPDAVEASVAELPTGLVTDQVARMPDRIGTFAREIAHGAHGEDLSYAAVPRFEGPLAVGRLDVGRVWESGTWRRGEWVMGRYRTRSRGRSSG